MCVLLHKCFMKSSFLPFQLICPPSCKPLAVPTGDQLCQPPYWSSCWQKQWFMQSAQSQREHSSFTEPHCKNFINSFLQIKLVSNIIHKILTINFADLHIGHQNQLPYFREQFPRKLFFFEFNLKYCDLWSQYIQVRKLFKGGNYLRKYGILKGVFSKPSGKYIVLPNLCLLSQRLQINAICLFFNFL